MTCELSIISLTLELIKKSVNGPAVELKTSVNLAFFFKRKLNFGFMPENISTCTVEHPLSACHPIAYFPLSNPSFHFSVDYCCSNNSKCSASLS